MTDDTFTLIETEETLAQNPEADRRYQQEGERYRSLAAALLASVRHLMTGREMRACENAAEGESFDASTIDALANQFPREAAAI